MSRYAHETRVSTDRSEAELKGLLVRYGADQFASGWRQEETVIQFRAHGRVVRFHLPMPDRADRAITHRRTRSGHCPRPPAQQERHYAQAVRSRWRALVLVVKAKLEAVASGITTFESEFLAHIVLPGGKSVLETALPEIEAAYARQQPPAGLLTFREEKP